MVSLINFPLFSYFFLGGDFSLLMPQTNTSPENWDAWKTILFLSAFALFSGAFAVSFRGCIKGLFPAEAAAVCWHDPDFDLCWGHRGGVKKCVELEDLWWIYCCPQKSSLEMFEDLCWKKWDKFHLLCNVYLYSTVYILPSQKCFTYRFWQGKFLGVPKLCSSFFFA